jgi:predicted phosphodiesterase
MRILTYSDLHLEFGSGWTLPPEAEGDILILAGDIVTFMDYGPLDRLLRAWRKPVLYVTGNHEYYTRRPMNEEDSKFIRWLATNHAQVTVLRDEEASIDSVNFFGGTMWTDFNGANQASMQIARDQMNDFRLIQNADHSVFKPADAIVLHANFVNKLHSWLRKDLRGPRVVISHHAPVIHPNTMHHSSPLRPAFNSVDMLKVIEEYQPDLWVYGHTHECDDQTVGSTRIISNQLGYTSKSGGFECRDFDPMGLPVDFET